MKRMSILGCSFEFIEGFMRVYRPLNDIFFNLVRCLSVCSSKVTWRRMLDGKKQVV